MGEDVDPLRAAAHAAVSALLELVRLGAGSVIVQRVGTFETFGAMVVGVSLIGRHQERTRKLMGFAQLSDGREPTEAAALAVLNATNRFLGLR